MSIKFEKRNGKSPKGQMIVYRDYVIFSETENFEDMVRTLSKKHKLTQTDIYANAIQLFYEKEKSEITISENRLMDAYRLARKKGGLLKIEQAMS